MMTGLQQARAQVLIAMSCLWRGVKCFYEDLEILTFLVILDNGTDGMEGGMLWADMSKFTIDNKSGDGAIRDCFSGDGFHALGGGSTPVVEEQAFHHDGS